MKMQCKKARRNISLALDSRLQPSAGERLKTHLDACPACRDWQKEQLELMGLMQSAQPLPLPSPGFYAVLRDKINEPRQRSKFFILSPFSYRPELLRAAIFLLFVFSALFGLFLGGRLERATLGADASQSVFSQVLNLGTFADLPADSFGAVYERLLQGELQ